MKKYILLIVIACFALKPAYSQKTPFHSIQEALNYHLDQLKAGIGHYNNIFIVTRLQDSVMLPSNVFKVEDGLEAKYLKKEDKNFLVEIRVATDVNVLKIAVTNYRVVKLSNKKIKLLNLSSGGTYEIR